MRDYLAMRQKPELKHEATGYVGSPLAEKHRSEMESAFGSRILDMTAEDYLQSIPPRKQASTRTAIEEMLSRQLEEMFDFLDGMRHSLADLPDYLAFHKVEPGDGEWHGVLGMRWGRRRSDAAIAADQAVRAASGEKVTPTAKRDDVSSDGSETPQQRYARLAGVAKGGGSSTLNDDDLAFFNKRTEAIKKVDKMFEEKPTWIRQTSNDVVRAVAKQQMQAVLSTVATKYISGNINEAITKAQADARNAAIKEGIKKGLDDATKKVDIAKTKNKIPIGFTAPVKK